MQNIYLQALEQQACSRGLNIHFTGIRPGFVDTALLSGDFRYPMKLRPLLAISDDDTLGIGSDCAARHIDGCPTVAAHRHIHSVADNKNFLINGFSCFIALASFGLTSAKIARIKLIGKYNQPTAPIYQRNLLVR